MAKEKEFLIREEATYVTTYVVKATSKELAKIRVQWDDGEPVDIKKISSKILDIKEPKL